MKPRRIVHAQRGDFPLCFTSYMLLPNLRLSRRRHEVTCKNCLEIARGRRHLGWVKRWP